MPDLVDDVERVTHSITDLGPETGAGGRVGAVALKARRLD